MIGKVSYYIITVERLTEKLFSTSITGRLWLNGANINWDHLHIPDSTWEGISRTKFLKGRENCDILAPRNPNCNSIKVWPKDWLVELCLSNSEETRLWLNWKKVKYEKKARQGIWTCSTLANEVWSHSDKFWSWKTLVFELSAKFGLLKFDWNWSEPNLI